MSSAAKSTFEITSWNQVPLEGAGTQLTRTTAGHRLTGDLEGEAVAELLMAHLSETAAEIAGFLRFSGTIGGKAGTGRQPVGGDGRA